ncbi:MAG TPA: hypothetical protein VHE35_32310 [Kofleriaceae bacterium]|nr:hypothetical protein [Kofleriaceae bacterium]
MLRTLCLLALATAGCSVVEPYQIEFDELQGSAFGADPCDCHLSQGALHLDCTSDGEVDGILLRIPPTPQQDLAIDLTVTTPDSPAGFTGTATARIDTLGDPVPEEGTDSLQLRPVSGLHVEWPHQVASGLELHSGKMLGGHGGCELDP